MMYGAIYLNYISKPTNIGESGISPDATGQASGIKSSNNIRAEAAPGIHIKERRTVALDSLYITLIWAEYPRVAVQIEPSNEICAWNTSSIVSPSLYTLYSRARDNAYKPKAESMVQAYTITVGSHINFTFRKRIYRLSLLEIPKPLLDFSPKEPGDFVRSHAIIRLLNLGEAGDSQYVCMYDLGDPTSPGLPQVGSGVGPDGGGNPDVDPRN